MAHFAKLGVDNIVLEVVYMDTIKTMTSGGIEKEEIGVAYLKEHHGHETWKKCSFNTFGNVHNEGGTPFRANYPGIGWYYDSTNDIFHSSRPTDKDGDPCTSWTLNTTTGLWTSPLTKPTLTDEETTAAKIYQWDESVYLADNTKGWVLV